MKRFFERYVYTPIGCPKVKKLNSESLKKISSYYTFISQSHYRKENIINLETSIEKIDKKDKVLLAYNEAYLGISYIKYLVAEMTNDSIRKKYIFTSIKYLDNASKILTYKCNPEIYEDIIKSLSLAYRYLAEIEMKNGGLTEYEVAALFYESALIRSKLFKIDENIEDPFIVEELLQKAALLLKNNTNDSLYFRCHVLLADLYSGIAQKQISNKAIQLESISASDKALKMIKLSENPDFYHLLQSYKNSSYLYVISNNKVNEEFVLAAIKSADEATKTSEYINNCKLIIEDKTLKALFILKLYEETLLKNHLITLEKLFLEIINSSKSCDYPIYYWLGKSFLGYTYFLKAKYWDPEDNLVKSIKELNESKKYTELIFIKNMGITIDFTIYSAYFKLAIVYVLKYILKDYLYFTIVGITTILLFK